ncbi:exopolysaccharide production repressor protein [Rhizobium sp. SG570]|uniref:exopolysaccharide production repressor protein n=1 Tax=Rhizobium sp. SG570 TaxID=2587113 RepID=UPI001444A2A5|nr:exopolysaccharide production repressor protein [Rhizobium sp. SG570]NKJ40315.1 hypothetical protein [Rhizobium sp. SG570]
MRMKDRDGVTYAPHVLFAMFCLLLVFAVVTYVVSGSIITTFFRTVISSICLQAGYFAVVVYLVLRRVKERKAKLTQNRASDEVPRTPVSSHRNADL